MSSRKSHKSYKSYKGEQRRLDGYTGDEELREFTFAIGIPSAQARFLKARNEIAEKAGRKLGDEIYQLMKYGKETIFEEPTEPVGDRLTYGQQKKYELEYRAYMEEMRQYKKSKGKLFRIIAGQCVPVLRTRIENMPDFKGLEEKQDVMGLMELIEGLVYNTGKGEYPYWTMSTNMRRVTEMRQGDKESLEAFAVRFMAQVENSEKVSGKWIPSNLKGKRSEEQEEGRNKLLACLFLGGCNRDQYKGVVDELYHDFGKGNNRYPDDITGVTELLNGRRGGSRAKDQEDDRHDGLVTSFAQMDIKSVVCYRCQEMGHYARDCPTRKRNQGQDGNGTVGRMINIDANTHASAFQLDEEGSSQSSYNSAQERADEWNAYYYW